LRFLEAQVERLRCAK